MKLRWYLWVLVAAVLVAAVGHAQPVRSKKVWEKQTMSADGTLMFRTYDMTVAQVTITVEDGSPDGSVTIYTRPSEAGGRVAVVAAYVPAGTKTWTGEAQNVLEVVLSGHSTGVIGVEVVAR